MSHESFTPLYLVFGSFASWTVFFLGAIYAVTLVLGLLSLKSPQDPISDPYFSILELIIILLAPLMVVCMVALHAYAASEVKVYSFTALVFMIITACITCCVHFIILTVSRQIESAGLASAPLFFSFKWPSVAYALDILAWDFFFALAILFAVPVFMGNGLETLLRWLMIGSGVLSLAGLIGVPLANMQVRMIGVIGYAGFAPVAFLLLGVLFGRI
jgi:hypothetical protein